MECTILLGLSWNVSKSRMEKHYRNMCWWRWQSRLSSLHSIFPSASGSLTPLRPPTIDLSFIVLIFHSNDQLNEITVLRAWLKSCAPTSRAAHPRRAPRPNIGRILFLLTPDLTVEVIAAGRLQVPSLSRDVGVRVPPGCHVTQPCGKSISHVWCRDEGARWQECVTELLRGDYNIWWAIGREKRAGSLGQKGLFSHEQPFVMVSLMFKSGTGLRVVSSVFFQTVYL